MKNAYINCLKELKYFRKSIKTENDFKRRKLYFTWIKDKTTKIENESNEEFVYKNVVNHTLNNYRIDRYIYERLNKKLKTIVNSNYILRNNNYVFNNKDISKEDTMLILKNILLCIIY